MQRPGCATRLGSVVRFVVVLAVALVWCGSAVAHGPRVIGIGQKQNKEDVQIHLGDTLVVSLPANPSTGYSWRIVQSDRHLLRPAGTGFVTSSAPPLAQGASGIAVFIFKTVHTGKVRLRLNYLSASNQAGRQFDVHVTIDSRQS